MPPVLPNKPRWILKESLAKVMLPPLLTAMGAEFSSWPCHLRKHWLQIFTLLTRINPAKRGRNENFNGLIRDFYPKGTDFKKLTALMYIRLRKSIEQQTQKASRRLNPA